MPSPPISKDLLLATTGKPLHDNDDTAAALAGLDAIELRDDGSASGALEKLKLSDKTAALTLLMRHMGMSNDKMRMQGDTENPLAWRHRSLSKLLGLILSAAPRHSIPVSE